MSGLVQQAVREAVERSGKAQALAGRLQALIGRSYNYRTISAWARGDAMPPGDALLATAKAADISLDALLGIGYKPTETEQQVAELLKRVEELQGELHAQADTQAKIIQELVRAGLWSEQASTEDRGAAGGPTS